MRQKIQSVDLHNIDRFIGKCGTNKYDAERKKLYGQLKFITESPEDEKVQVFLEKENSFAIIQQDKFFESESKRIEVKYNKARKEIVDLSLPEDELKLQLRSVEDDYHTALRKLTDDVNSKKEYYTNRTVDELKTDLAQRQEVVTERYERRKNLAQKALDLHWMEGVAKDEYDEDSIYNPINWINNAPLGTIKRAHKMMRNESAPEAIIKYALADIIVGKRGMNREDFQAVSELYDSAKKGDWEEKRHIESIMTVGGIVSSAGYEVSLDDLSSMAEQQYSGMAGCLKKYPLEAVREFMSQSVNLDSVTTVKEITDKFGHSLSNDEVLAMAKQNITGLEGAMKSFSLVDVQALLSQDVSLPTATSVLKNTQQFGYTLSLDQIASIAKGVNDVDDFKNALKGLPLTEVEELYAKSISYHDFSITKAALHSHNYNFDFGAIVNTAEKLATQNEYEMLNTALEHFSLDEVESILSSGVRLSNVIDVKGALINNSVVMNLPEIIQVTQLSGDWSQGSNVTKTIETFGLEVFKHIVSKGCRIDKAVNVNNQIHGNGGGISSDLKESLKKGGIETVIAIAKAGNMDVAVKTIEAGFSADEITRYPFLISSLVSQSS